jgi:hypothetical protein
MSSVQKTLFLSIGLGSALALIACGNDTGNPGGSTGGIGGVAGMVGAGGGLVGGGGGAPPTGGAAGAAGGAAGAGLGTGCDDINYDAFKTGGDPISLRQDLLPMFGLSCVVSDCHAPKDHKAGLTLGNKCAYDMNAKWKCTFPPMPDPSGDPSKPAPDDEAMVAQIYKDLLDPAVTVNGGMVKRVAPGDPANSFFLLKLADQQNSKGYMCTNQDPSHESSPPPCGVSMPQNQEKYCTASYRARFNAIAYWIAQGAKNN